MRQDNKLIGILNFNQKANKRKDKTKTIKKNKRKRKLIKNKIKTVL